MSHNSLEATLSQPQKKAIEHYKGPMMVLAGPGSGKTFVITRRIRHLINNHKVSGDKILVITFTKNSALEMQERFENLMVNEFLPVTFGTFHGVFLGILKESFGYGIESIITEKEKNDLLRIAIKDNSSNEQTIDFEYIQLILSEISRAKNMGNPFNSIKINGINEDLLHRVIIQYCNSIRELKKIDFDDMIIECYRNLSENPEVLNYWRSRYEFILIDEFQDINQIQYDVIKLLLGKNNNIFVVGDDDQSIYGFRGSKPGIMLNFPEEFKDCESVLLNTNYRCNEDIVNKSVELINHNNKRFKKEIIANRKSNKKVSLIHFASSQKQYEKMIDIIKITKRKSLYSDIAIIFRTNSATKGILKALNDNKIPYSFKEKIKSFFKSYIALDILSILAFASGEKTRSNFLKFMNKPVRYVPRSLIDEETIDIDKLIKRAGSKQYLVNNLVKLKYQISVIKDMDIFQAIVFIRKQMMVESFMLEEARNRNKDENEIKEILNLMQDSAKGINTYKEYLEYIESFERTLSDSASEDSKDRVNIITMHGSKGLEYKTVIIPDLCEGYVPQPKAVTIDDIEEERRMFYVAMTRAKDNLFLFYTSMNKERKLKKSRFLNDIVSLEDIEG